MFLANEFVLAQGGNGAYISTTAKTSAWLIAQHPNKEEYLVSPNGRYWLIMGMDGRLGLYEGKSLQDRSKLLWSKNGAPGLGNYFLNMQNDGNLAVWSGIPSTSSAKANGWTSGTPGPAGNYFLVVQDDANVVVYRGTGPKDNQGALWFRLTGRISQAPASEDRTVIGRGTLPDCSRMEWRQVYNATLKTARQDAVAYLYLNHTAIQAAQGAIQSCAAQGAVAGIIAGLFTGAGSLPAAKAAFSACLASNNVEKSVTDSIVITVESTCDW
jgi:hypothetical protein